MNNKQPDAAVDAAHPGDLTHRIVRGAGWTVLLRFAIRSLGVVSTIILARLLTPADYGIVAIATLLAAAVTVLSSFNFEVWLIRHRNPAPHDYNTIFTLGILRGAVTTLALAGLAVPMSVFFSEPRLVTVLYVLAASNFAASFINVGTVEFRRELEFDKDFRLLAGSRLGGALITIALAVVFRNHWALVGGLVATDLLTVAISYRLHAFRPRFCLVSWRPVMNFTKWLLAASILRFVYLRSDTFILGKLGTTGLVGTYSMAHTLANLAATEIVTPIRRALMPGYAKMRHDPPRLRAGFVDGFGIIVLLGLPFALGVGLTADPLVRTLLGDQWLDTIPLIKILAIYGLASIGLSNQSPVLLAMGRTGLASALVAVSVAVLLPAFWYGMSQHGLIGAAVAATIANGVLFVIGLIATVKVLNISVRRLLDVSWRTVVGALIMTGAVWAVQETAWSQVIWPVALLMVCALVGALAYGGAIFLLWHMGGRGPGPEDQLLEYLQSRRAARPSP